ncbi:MAG: PD-(D/E)XK motif protein [Ruminococcus sp.]|nr:PD-(D/E)XK motif protein [Ruminococcus sp.]
MEISILPSEYTAWTIKQEHWIGVTVAINKDIDFAERFANVRLYTEKNVVISGKEYTLLILRCDAPALRDEFSTICYHFVDSGETGDTRKLLKSKPEEWWNKWKSLLGNRHRHRSLFNYRRTFDS